MAFSVAVAGCTGYAGGEVLRYLLGRPDIEIGALTAGGSAGKKLGEFHPNLWPLADRVVQPSDPAILAGHDIVFMGLPHGTSGPIAAQLPAETLIIDLGPDHRLTSQGDWDKFYGGDYSPAWTYGLPELPGQREALANTKRIAVPGCYVTTVTLSLLPALTSGLIDGRDIVVAAASGSSGAGKAAKPNLLGAEMFGSMSAYGVGGTHRHVPEILQNLRSLGANNPTLSFTPVLAPMARGIMAVCTAPLLNPDETTATDAQAAYRAAYDQESFLNVCPDGVWPSSKWVLGSNGFAVQVTVDAQAGRLVAVGTLDNLAKGTASQAIQAMNIALGLDETTGLNNIGVAP
ncbi:MAG: N-acetyl-gamma-glutamyl-phosphate reductase [Propionibacteriaceae bacterium]|jgi:N-acetyl-gamma-glutamyl-phosphate reductase|nr:N-acetyl-gamma-glutamyl-phosphate reductase [Propionibacteriaceae bacterium]